MITDTMPVIAMIVTFPHVENNTCDFLLTGYGQTASGFYQ